VIGDPLSDFDHILTGYPKRRRPALEANGEGLTGADQAAAQSTES
jgi:hypothetical protein